MSGKCFIHQIPMVALTMMNTFTATELKVYYTDRYQQQGCYSQNDGIVFKRRIESLPNEYQR